MDPYVFAQIEQRMQQTAFADDKSAVINSSYAYGHFSVYQVAQLLRHFPHSGDQLKALQILQHRIVGLTAMDVRAIIDKMSISSDKMQALEILARQISDHTNEVVILDGFAFHTDKQKAQQILMQSHQSFPHAASAPTAYPGVTTGSYPIGPTGYSTSPFPASAAGSAYPPPVQGSYPGHSAAYPAQIPGSYPNTSSAYPPHVPGTYLNASAAYPPPMQGPAYPGSSPAYHPQTHGAYPPVGQSQAYLTGGGAYLPPTADPMGDMRAAGHIMMGGGAVGGIATGMQAPGVYLPSGPPGYPPPPY